VLFAAYTGKAAHVMRQHGMPNARTVCSLTYAYYEESIAKILAEEEG
jgi:hypothetical protein